MSKARAPHPHGRRARLRADDRHAMVAPSPAPVKRKLIIFLATGAYSGYSPVAPGTAGAAVGLVLVRLGCAPLWRWAPGLFLAAFAAVFLVSCRIAGQAEEIFDERDSPRIVLDEVLGMAATMFLNPTRWQYLIGGFVLFRLSDIIKPFPAALVERRMRGGAAVMLDDFFAAIYANLALRLAARLL